MADAVREEKEVIDEYNKCVEEVQKLRALFLKKKEAESDNSLEETVQKLAERQASNLESVNDFLSKFTANSAIEDRLRCGDNVVSMPDRRSASNFVQFAKTAAEIMDVMDSNKSESGPELHTEEFYKQETSDLQHLSLFEDATREFNTNYNGVTSYFKKHRANSTEAGELDDLTINSTIKTEDVLTSSPLSL